MSGPLYVTVVTAILILLSAFFVIIEFALMGARRHRLEDVASHSASARAALRGMNDLTLMLAGAQLGITVCTFALGAITKPAIDYWIGPNLIGLGVPEFLAGSASFLISIFLVTFLHLVVGEMAPKSWAIANPERSAMAIGLMARAYIWPLRPVLGWVNRVANRLVAASGVTPVESAAVGGRDMATIRQLVEHSAKVGTLEPQVQKQISGLIDLGTMPVRDIIAVGNRLASVAPDATIGDVRAMAQSSGHMRIVMLGADPSKLRVVHARDTLMLGDGVPAAKIARKAVSMDARTPVYEALAQMREASVQLAVVLFDGKVAGLVTLGDITSRLLPRGGELVAEASRR
ncbi:Hemolysin, contains CBS domains [Devosia lucknowensis]|uniref:Hemolysin, contains CBS domains n=1 Tax=Devosia lucknowensis TaxID=1096929 RepID=A0A1Y6F2A9_9HYPH|nr:CNNM domain-containing protein [Devosia lucknowensis]SMQ68719.1 Hemolysin, contains CBS domains [Devosia lucknowensis]